MFCFFIQKEQLKRILSIKDKDACATETTRGQQRGYTVSDRS